MDRDCTRLVEHCAGRLGRPQRQHSNDRSDNEAGANDGAWAAEPHPTRMTIGDRERYGPRGSSSTAASPIAEPPLSARPAVDATRAALAMLTTP